MKLTILLLFLAITISLPTIAMENRTIYTVKNKIIYTVEELRQLGKTPLSKKGLPLGANLICLILIPCKVTNQNPTGKTPKIKKRPILKMIKPGSLDQLKGPSTDVLSMLGLEDN